MRAPVFGPSWAPRQQLASMSAICMCHLGHPAHLSLQITEALAGIWLQLHKRLQTRTAQTSLSWITLKIMKKVKLLCFFKPPNLVNCCLAVETYNQQQEENEHWWSNKSSGSSETQGESPSSGGWPLWSHQRFCVSRFPWKVGDAPSCWDTWLRQTYIWVSQMVVSLECSSNHFLGRNSTRDYHC